MSATFAVAVTTDGRVFTAGLGRHGRLGYQLDGTSRSFQRVPDLPSIRSASAGESHVVAVPETGASVLCWGHATACGVGGHSPRAVEFELPGTVQKACAGALVSMVLCCDGSLYTWGSPRNDLLGRPNDGALQRPARVAIDAAVADMDLGVLNACAVTEEGALFVWGSPSSRCMPPDTGPSPVEHPFFSREGVALSSASCSRSAHHGFMMAIDRDGRVYTWGWTYKGQLGDADWDHAAAETRTTPRPLDPAHFDGARAVRACAGGIHAAVVTEAGALYTWGCGSDGRLGHPEAAGHRYLFKSSFPRRVARLHGTEADALAVADVSCGYYNTAIVAHHREGMETRRASAK